MSHLAIVLELTGRRCVVIGGGPVAARKAEALLEAGARVTVVAPRVTPSIASLAATGAVRWERRDYRRSDLRGATLAFVATSDERVKDAVACHSREARVWVNAADDPARCDFFMPAVIRRGPLTVAVSTGGTSPALARLVRNELEERLTADYGVLAELAGDVRRELRARDASPPGDTWVHALGRDDLRRLIAAGRVDDARDRLRSGLAATRGPVGPNGGATRGAPPT